MANPKHHTFIWVPSCKFQSHKQNIDFLHAKMVGKTETEL